MTDVWDGRWDMYRAELADTVREGQHEHPTRRPCVFCGRLTKSLYRVCLDHDDLIDVDPGYPAALVETRTSGSDLGERGALPPVGGSSRQPVRAALDTPEAP